MVGQVAQELIERGKAQGLALGMAGALTRVLERRFGMLPRAVRRWIATASASELDSLLTVTLGAKSLADVFPELYLD